jgi:transcriptional regulator with XRE-family HTH domain
MPRKRTLPYDADKIRDLREQAGLSLVQLGDRTGHHPESLRNIERRNKNASAVTLGRIAIALGVDLRDITLPEDAPDAPAQVAS